MFAPPARAPNLQTTNSKVKHAEDVSVTDASIRDLQVSVERLHGCTAAYVEAVAVHEQHGGATVWQGVVQVFEVDHPQANRAYAWSYIVDERTQRRRFLAILGIPPVNSPADAVRAAIASGQQE